MGTMRVAEGSVTGCISYLSYHVHWRSFLLQRRWLLEKDAE